MSQSLSAPAHGTGTEPCGQDVADMRLSTSAISSGFIPLCNGYGVYVVPQVPHIVTDRLFPFRVSFQKPVPQHSQLLSVSCFQCLADQMLILASRLAVDAAQSLFDRFVFMVGIQNKLTLWQPVEPSPDPCCPVSMQVDSGLAQIIPPLYLVADLFP